jgi:hypothetical protein
VNDPVNHPSHYTSHSSGIEVIEITEHLSFCLGNAVKYILRRKLKNSEAQDLAKASWYLAREVQRLERLDESATYWHPETAIRRLITHEPPGDIHGALVSIADGRLDNARVYISRELKRLS